MTVADQRATQRLLQAALTVLEGFYDKKAANALMQKQEPVGPLPPPGFKEYNMTVVGAQPLRHVKQVDRKYHRPGWSHSLTGLPLILSLKCVA